MKSVWDTTLFVELCKVKTIVELALRLVANVMSWQENDITLGQGS